MNNTAAAFLIIVGLIITLAGVGGVEHSFTHTELAGATAIALLGILTMACGVIAQRINNHYGDGQ